MKITPHHGFDSVDKSIEKYKKDGFSLFPKIFDDNFIDSLLGTVEKYKSDDRLQYDRSEKHVNMAFWSAKVDKDLDELRTSKALFDLCSKILDTNDIKQHIQHIFFREQGNADSFPWHRDEIFRGNGLANPRRSYVAMAIYLDDITEVEQGAVFYVPGSHHWGDKSGLASYQMIQDRKGGPWQMQGPFEECEVMLPSRGMVGVWNAGTIHGSQPNQTPRDRRYILHGYARADSVSDPEYVWAWRNGCAVPWDRAMP